MVEKLYYLIEEITMIVCLFGLYGKKVKVDILTMVALVVNIAIYSLFQEGYIGNVYSVLALIVLFVYSLYEFNQCIKTTASNLFICIILITTLQLFSVLPMGLIRMFIHNDDVIWIFINLLILTVIIAMKDKFLFISKSISNSRCLSIFPILLGMLEIMILFVNFKVHKAVELDIYLVIIIFAVLIVCLFQKWYESKIELKIKEHQLNVSSIYNGTFDKFADDVVKRQHDIKNHFNAIYSMHYTCNSYEELVNGQRKYCDEILHLARFDRLLNLNMPILAGFLYSKFHEVEEAGVTIDYKIELDAKELSVPTYEMITILGILIDNAKEKAETLEPENRIVKVKINEDDKYVYFMLKNINEYIKINDIKKLFKKGYSTKGDTRGIGLCTVKKKSFEYKFDVLVENEKIDEKHWIVFGIVIKK